MKALLALGIGVCIVAAGVWYFLQNKAPAPPSNTVEAPTVPGGVAVPIYFYDPARDRDGTGNQLCSKRGLVAVARTLAPGHTLTDRINLVLGGIVATEEANKGIQTEYPLTGLKLVSATLEGSKAVLTFEDRLNKTSGGACRSAILWYQIEATALTYPGVADVEFMPKTLFQP